MIERAGVSFHASRAITDAAHLAEFAHLTTRGVRGRRVPGDEAGMFPARIEGLRGLRIDPAADTGLAAAPSRDDSVSRRL